MFAVAVCGTHSRIICPRKISSALRPGPVAELWLSTSIDHLAVWLYLFLYREYRSDNHGLAYTIGPFRYLEPT